MYYMIMMIDRSFEYLPEFVKRQGCQLKKVEKVVVLL